MDKPNYYGILPASVRYDKGLKPMEKILYTEFTALSNKYGYCNASNSYFASLYGVSKSTVSRWVSNMQKQGHIKTDLVYEPDTNNVKERRVYPLTKRSIPIDEKINTPIDEKINTPIDEKRKVNNTSNNNTSINSIESDNNIPNFVKENRRNILKDIENTKRFQSAEGFARAIQPELKSISEYLTNACKGWRTKSQAQKIKFLDEFAKNNWINEYGNAKKNWLTEIMLHMRNTLNKQSIKR